jgi:hypothetical protein
LQDAKVGLGAGAGGLMAVTQRLFILAQQDDNSFAAVEDGTLQKFQIVIEGITKRKSEMLRAWI